MEYLKSRKNSYAVLLSGLLIGVVIAFLINDDPDLSTLAASGAIGVVIGEGLMFWQWNRQKKKNSPGNERAEDGKGGKR